MVNRKEISFKFVGVATDGSFTFKALIFLPISGGILGETRFNITSYEKGNMEIAVAHDENTLLVSAILSGLFSTKSIFSVLNLLVLNYRNIHLEIRKNSNKEDIMDKLTQAMINPEYKDSNNHIGVDTRSCQERHIVDFKNEDIYSNSFYFDGIDKKSKSLRFKNFYRYLLYKKLQKKVQKKLLQQFLMLIFLI